MHPLVEGVLRLTAGTVVVGVGGEDAIAPAGAGDIKVGPLAFLAAAATGGLWPGGMGRSGGLRRCPLWPAHRGAGLLP